MRKLEGYFTCPLCGLIIYQSRACPSCIKKMGTLAYFAELRKREKEVIEVGK